MGISRPRTTDASEAMKQREKKSWSKLRWWRKLSMATRRMVGREVEADGLPGGVGAQLSRPPNPRDLHTQSGIGVDPPRFFILPL